MKKRIILSLTLVLLAFTAIFAYMGFNAYKDLKELKTFTQSGDYQNSIKAGDSLASNYAQLQKENETLISRNEKLKTEIIELEQQLQISKSATAAQRVAANIKRTGKQDEARQLIINQIRDIERVIAKLKANE